MATTAGSASKMPTCVLSIGSIIDLSTMVIPRLIDSNHSYSASILHLDITWGTDYTIYIMSWSAERDDEGHVRVRIEGVLDEAAGQQVIDTVVRLLGSQPRDIIFDIDATAGYRRSVRIAWQTALLPVRGRIRRFVVNGGGSVTRMSINVMAMSLGVPVEGAQVDPDAPVRRDATPSNSQARTRPLSRAVSGPSVRPDPPKRERSWAGQILRRIREESRPNF